MKAKPKPAFRWDQVDRLHTSGMNGDNAPPDAFTNRDYAAKYGLPIKTASDQLARLVLAGKLKTEKVLAPTSGGRRMVRVYWLV
jgi:hypothetical protein